MRRSPSQVKNPFEAHLLPVLADPEQTAALAGDFVDDREVLVSPLPQHLVDPDRRDPLHRHPRPPPLDCHLHGAKHRGPAGREDACHLGPAQPPGPARQKPHVAPRQLVLARRPRHALHLHAARGTLHPPHRIDQHPGHPPPRHVLKAARRQRVGAGSRLAAARTHRQGAGGRPHRDLDPLAVRAPAGLLVDKPRMLLDAIQDSLHPHPGRSSWSICSLQNPSSQEGRRDAPARAALGDCASPLGLPISEPVLFLSSDTRVPIFAAEMAQAADHIVDGAIVRSQLGGRRLPAACVPVHIVGSCSVRVARPLPVLPTNSVDEPIISTTPAARSHATTSASRSTRPSRPSPRARTASSL